jgi:hypothetical protein
MDGYRPLDMAWVRREPAMTWGQRTQERNTGDVQPAATPASQRARLPGRQSAPALASLPPSRSMMLRMPLFRSRTSRSTSDGYFIELPFPPLVESWERRDHPSQVRLDVYRNSVRTLAGQALTALEPPLALGFHVAGRRDVASGDLENFLTPVVKGLGGGDAFAFVWATRGQPNERASLTLLRASDARLDMTRYVSHIATHASLFAHRVEWKMAVAAAVGRHESAHGNEPIELGIRFGIAPHLNWMALWKPAIDALGGVLGEGLRPWHPRDDRISLLMLQRKLRPQLGWKIQLDFWWSATSPHAS